MSVKLTIVFFILICFEIGILLVILPWVASPSWNENYLLVLAADKMQWPWLALAMKSGYARGAVTGLGLLNILLGVWEIVNFKKLSEEWGTEVLIGEWSASTQEESDAYLRAFKENGFGWTYYSWRPTESRGLGVSLYDTTWTPMTIGLRQLVHSIESADISQGPTSTAASQD